MLDLGSRFGCVLQLQRSILENPVHDLACLLWCEMRWLYEAIKRDFKGRPPSTLEYMVYPVRWEVRPQSISEFGELGVMCLGLGTCSSLIQDPLPSLPNLCLVVDDWLYQPKEYSSGLEILLFPVPNSATPEVFHI